MQVKTGYEALFDSVYSRGVQVPGSGCQMPGYLAIGASRLVPDTTLIGTMFLCN